MLVKSIEVFKKIDVRNHRTAKDFIHSDDSFMKIDIEDVVGRIIKLNSAMAKFWKNAKGWAPLQAAQLLTKSRLDWQVSLSHSLKKWLEVQTPEMAESALILGWANLGSLVEGTMKLFLSAYYKDYQSDVKAIKNKGKLIDPDSLQLETLRQFFKDKIWDSEFDEWVLKIQQRRNAIHAFKDRELGDREEFLKSVREYLKLLRYINFRLPYPDEIYEPREI